jgi:hypothetical protein
MEPKHPSSRRYPPEVKQRAIELVIAAAKQSGERHGHVSRYCPSAGHRPRDPSPLGPPGRDRPRRPPRE